VRGLRSPFSNCKLVLVHDGVAAAQIRVSVADLCSREADYRASRSAISGNLWDVPDGVRDVPREQALLQLVRMEGRSPLVPD